MKKACVAALCFVLVCLVLVHGTLALPELNSVFQYVQGLLENGTPREDRSVMKVELLSDGTTQNLYPGGTVARSFYVKNSGTMGAYFRLVYALQYDEQSWSKLTVNFKADKSFTQCGWQDITIGSTPYKMMVFTYTKALEAGKQSPAVELTMTMNEAMTSEEMSRYRSDFLQTQVLAIECKSFTDGNYTTAEAALEAALPLDKLNPF